jgi:2-polyprenyl-6-methoxyphenol hydroxylase-like FAD-dependent oxidoreductase
VRVIVAGAGIGGLSAALSPHAAGIRTVVIDPAASLRASRRRAGAAS